MNTSFEEKIAWIELLVLLILYGDYFLTARQMLAAGILELSAYAPLFIRTVILLVVVMIIATIATVVINRGDQSDERDRLIGWKAESRSSWLLALGVLAALVGLVADLEPVQLAHVLLGSLVLSEVLKLGLQLVYYRRGI